MKLNYKKTILIGLAFLSISAFWQMYDNVIPLILKNTFGLGETFTGVIMATDNVLALFLLPFFGNLSDKINTPIGKRMPFILVGTAIAVTLIQVLGHANNIGSLPLFTGTLLVLLIAMGLYRSPAVALMPDLTPKPLTSKGNAIINLMGAVGGVAALGMIKLLVGSGLTPDYRPLFTGVSVLMVVCVVILFLSIKENKLRKEMRVDLTEEEMEQPQTTKDLPKDMKRSLSYILTSVSLWYVAYNAVTTAFSRYATQVWQMENGGYANCLLICTIAAIVSYLPIGMIASKIGRKKTIQLGVILLVICFFSAGLYSNYHGSLIIFFGMIGFAWAAINVNSLPMVIEIASAGEVGKYTGLYYTFSMSAQVITPVLSGILLEYVSYRTLFPYAVFFSICAFITISQVKHGDTKPLQKKSVLENFDVED